MGTVQPPRKGPSTSPRGDGTASQACEGLSTLPFVQFPLEREPSYPAGSLGRPHRMYGPASPDPPARPTTHLPRSPDLAELDAARPTSLADRPRRRGPTVHLGRLRRTRP